MNLSSFILIPIIPASKLLTDSTIVSINLGLTGVDKRDLILKIALEINTLNTVNGLWEVN